ncbi:DUF799 domain-containing protein [Photobacterium nomapromontoriensis]|uniref:DUF799 domain-containing protein n=1 Tax=Photobacterium nomapromontoriensis TaxID=2910237 RepID=UPI003D0B87CE
MPSKYFKFFSILFFTVILSACQTTKVERQTGFEQHKPRSILILPVVNNSVDVDASLAVYSSLPVVLAEKGYYVYPINTVKTILEQEGLYEPAEIHKVDTKKMSQLFGADAILYVTINKWDTTWLLLSSTTSVDFNYEFKDKDGNTIWQTTKHLEYTPQNSSSGNLIVDLVSAAISATINRIAPDYMPLTRMANYQVFYQDPSSYLPNGPYLTKEKTTEL